MKVLGIETATRAGGAALLDDDGLVGEAFSREDTTYSRRLLPSIHRLLQDAGWRPDQIDLVAVSLGPGSFTGLRIGLAAAKGFAVAAQAQLIGVSTLDAFAFLIAKASLGLAIRPVIDARKSEVFTAPFDQNGARIGPDENIAPEKLAKKIEKEGRVVIAGDGVSIYGEIFMNILGDLATRPPPELDTPRPGPVAELGLLMYRQGVRHEIESMSPAYVRAPDAVINPRSHKKTPSVEPKK